MPGKLEALSILLILLPGFLATYVVQQLSVRREQSDFDKVIEALVFSFGLYVLTLPLFGWHLPLSWKPLPDGSFSIVANAHHIGALFVSSLALAIVCSSSINRDWAHKLFRFLKITERTARRSIWNDAFQELGGFAQVQLKDGKKVIGWIRYYADQSEDSSLFLERAAWVEDNGTERAIEGPGVLLTKEAEIESVMFLSWSTSDAAPPVPSELDT